MTSTCERPDPPKPVAVPDNVSDDLPIILKEGQAVILVPETDKNVRIGASVVDGKLSIAEIDPEGKNFGVTWHDKDSWETSSIVSDDSGHTVIIDRDGDGLPNLKVVVDGADGGSRRFDFEEVRWQEQPAKDP